MTSVLTKRGTKGDFVLVQFCIFFLDVCTVVSPIPNCRATVEVDLPLFNIGIITSLLCPMVRRSRLK